MFEFWDEWYRQLFVYVFALWHKLIKGAPTSEVPVTHEQATLISKKMGRFLVFELETGEVKVFYVAGDDFKKCELDATGVLYYQEKFFFNFVPN